MHSMLSAQLEAAVLALVGHGALKDRLCAALCDHLDDLREPDLPEEVQGEYAAMTRVMHGARALPGDSVVRASIRKLSNEEAERYAGLIVRAYGLRIHELAAALRAAPRAAASQTLETTPLAALLALEGGARAGTRQKQAGRG